tara:strand:+ start:213 stop:416 length:204 start_codon:yes stop_codon:yes gene_type:complete
MKKGKVKWFNPNKGYGFISPEEGSKDIFVHMTTVQKAGLKTLIEGQEVSYDEATNKGRVSAGNLKLI